MGPFGPLGCFEQMQCKNFRVRKNKGQGVGFGEVAKETNGPSSPVSRTVIEEKPSMLHGLNRTCPLRYPGLWQFHTAGRVPFYGSLKLQPYCDSGGRSGQQACQSPGFTLLILTG
ncbi:UNVERIFIED_CONTAM: hypothetical protein K2H54_012773 [Gekko kuhli]